MSDHLLRLAKIVEELTYLHPDKAFARDAYALVRDLEAEAAQAPERRTITRAELSAAMSIMRSSRAGFHDDARAIASVWRLTVED